MQRHSLYRISSMTKPVTGMATLVLAAEGKFGLDDPWTDGFRSWPITGCCGGWTDRSTTPSGAERAITPRQLLTFTFGFGLAMEMFAAPEPWPIVAEANHLLA